ncbi:CRISPR-associated endonuclease Cas1 [Candidatus Venteria ishoeyi]|uniref:CRISPR-associated endonuclease Cas1 n=1 Tax=Candidatus Venteria ishoeyi TaxID=1899563 RepID=UPI0025A58C99|nr:CRISPR-associated endonuclease Cas1 [Candidatus Venteria ishoeyi]MDM8545489.1 CRISPR-associated endonuclease Cas1 [Candidatus Venteria ishoeyi]
MPLSSLLPLRAISVTLQFTENSKLPFYHQSIVNAWLRYLFELPDTAYENYLCIDTPETGCIDYRAKDYYRFTLIAIRGGETGLQHLLEKLQQLPHSVRHSKTKQPLRDNLRLHQACDLFTGKAIEHTTQLSVYDLPQLQAETNLWQYAQTCYIRWLSPLRLLLPKAQRDKNAKGEARFCREASELNYKHLNEALYNTINTLLRQREQTGFSLPDIPSGTLNHHQLFWMDQHYGKQQKPMGGFLGLLQLDCRQFTPQHWQNWIIGQYLGIGRFRIFGWGRYQIEGMEGEISLQRSEQASTQLQRVCTPDNMQRAWQHVSRQQQVERITDSTMHQMESDIPTDKVAARLEQQAQQLLNQTYAIPPLKGIILQKTGRDPRPLAVPPFFDRISQRATTQILTPALETLMYEHSYGYRRGRSRHQVAQKIQQAYRQGYRWVFESDIEDFFDNVSWEQLHTRLHALFGDEPLIELIMTWISAPVQFDGKLIQRRAGLPQGSPLSPLLANLLLDDFDSDLDTAGYLLLRFADDFVILGKTRAEVEDAARHANASISELGMTFNPKKTAITDFEQGFRFLGYLFVNGLALDAGGEKDPDYQPQIPPGSWLADTTITPETLQQTTNAQAGAGLQPAPERFNNAGLQTQSHKTQAPETNPDTRIGEREELGIYLFINGSSALLSTREERLHIQQQTEDPEQPETHSYPWRNLETVILFGSHHLTTPALKAAFKHQVAIHYATRSGEYQGLASSIHTRHQHSRLWLEQHLRFQDKQQSLNAALSLVQSRLRHQGEVLRRYNTDKQFNQSLTQLQNLLAKARYTQDFENLNGYEGQGAKIYFQALQKLVPEALGFGGRNRRPPRDPFNVLLSLGYTILYNHVETLCYASGLQPWVGLYHQPHGRHAVLASDLMEPFRHIIERVALTAVRQNQINPDDFSIKADGSCYMANEARKKYLILLSEAFEKPFKAYRDEQPYKLHEHLHRQNLQLIDWIHGKTDHFQAWKIK